jgi:hypothetical protein
VGTKVLLAHDGDNLGTQVLDPLRTCVKVSNCCDPPYTGTLTCIKIVETCVESTFATVCVRSAIVGCFLLFW